jgi:GT2 family glycosyltransferase
MLYADHDYLDSAGERCDPFFKPDWSPDLMLSMDYIGDFLVVRRALAIEAGGIRSDLDGSETYDLALRVSERSQQIAHLPRVLYHARRAAPHTGAQRVLTDTLERRGIAAEVSATRPGLFRVRYRREGRQRVSIVIPTRDKWQVLKTAVDSIEQRSSHKDYELLIVDNGSAEEGSLRYLDELRSRHRVIREDGPFNWSGLNNVAAAQAGGDFLLFLNNDVEVITPDWLEAMLEHAQRPSVGAVGARLLYPNGTIQHAGVLMGVGGTANHAFRTFPGDSPGYFGFASVVRNYSAVTGACMMTRKALFDEVGGFDEELPVAFNDIDFCLRLLKHGLLVVYTPHAALYHFESASRGSLHPMKAETFMAERWGDAVKIDRYYNPNLTLHYEDFRLRF